MEHRYKPFVRCLLILLFFAPARGNGDTTTQVSVQANQPWTDTGIDLAGGSNVSITASGTIATAGSDSKTPAGAPECGAPSDFVAPGLPCWSLIGRIGSGTPFYVGTTKGFSVDTSGRLFLGVNDNVFSDNFGSWAATVTVTVIAPPPPPASLPPVPGWYSNSGANGQSIIYQDSSLRILWGNSYIFRHPGTDNLYWYTQVEYRNTGSQPLTLTCVGAADRSLAKEHIRGTEGLPPGASGFVPAEETFCSRNPNLTFSIEPGGAHYSWAIFHNVPPGGEVSLEWYGFFSPWVDPWHSAYPLTTPRPAECPPELVSLGTCQSKVPEGTAPNLIVLVHGCCTDTRGVYEWHNLADTIAGEIIKKRTPWEIMVWDWHEYTPTTDFDPQDVLKDYRTAYENALLPSQAPALANAIANHRYDHVHLIGHSSGAKFIQVAAEVLAIDYKLNNIQPQPFIHLTFLDAYTRDNLDTLVYGFLPNYPNHYSEHYVDIGLPSTDAILTNAFDFDITHWPHNPLQFLGGHQWPRYWYERSVTTPGSRCGFALSAEGGNNAINTLPKQNSPEEPARKLTNAADCESGGVPPLPSPTPTPTPSLPPVTRANPGAAIVCQGAACGVSLTCNNDAQCITEVTIFVRARRGRPNSGAAVTARRALRLASSMADIPPRQTASVRPRFTKRGKVFLRASRADGKKRFNGTLQLRDVLTGTVISNTPIRIRLR